MQVTYFEYLKKALTYWLACGHGTGLTYWKQFIILYLCTLSQVSEYRSSNSTSIIHMAYDYHCDDCNTLDQDHAMKNSPRLLTNPYMYIAMVIIPILILRKLSQIGLSSFQQCQTQEQKQRSAKDFRPTDFREHYQSVIFSIQHMQHYIFSDKILPKPSSRAITKRVRRHCSCLTLLVLQTLKQGSDESN